MTLSPDDIEHKQFQRVSNGYDVEEVRGFLGSLAADLRSARLAGHADPFSGFGEEMAALMRSATAVADQVKREAHEEAARIRARAASDSAEMQEHSKAQLEGATQAREAAEREAEQILTTATERAQQTLGEARAELEAAQEARKAADQAAQQHLADASAEAADALQLALGAFDNAVDLEARTKDDFQRHVEREREAAQEQAVIATVVAEVARAGAEEWEGVIRATRAALERADSERERAERDTAELRAAAASQAQEMLDAARQHLEAVAHMRSSAERTLEAMRTVRARLGLQGDSAGAGPVDDRAVASAPEAPT